MTKKYDVIEQIVQDYACSWCGAAPHVRCKSDGGLLIVLSHQMRYRAAARAGRIERMKDEYGLYWKILDT